MVASSRTYAVLGATGNCGAALIENLLKHEDTRINAYCRNTEKLMRLFPDIKAEGRVKIFEGNIQDIELLASCIRNCQAVFLVVSTNDNIPGCRLSQDTAAAAIQALLNIQQQCGAEDGDHGVMRMVTPKLVLLSSGTIDEQFSRHVPLMLQPILLRSASYVYRDLIETEKLLRAQQDWLTTIYIKPGALSIDIQRGHALSLTDQDSPVSYLDLAAAMIEAAEDETGRYENRNVSVVNTNGAAKFPTGTPLCILMGLLRHFFPFLHPYLPMNTGP
ncbi:putative NAD-dependent epimerase/dehydratase [Corynascus similis CBS 632.67]